MKHSFIISSIFLLTLLSCSEKESSVEENWESKTNANYLSNRAPLVETPYLELPLGTIKPEGWLKDQLERMASGLTGNLDEVYPEVLGERNGWLGGDGDGWERGPYWIDGLLPLAYILNDEKLKAKVRPWIDWTLNNQRSDGYLGPIPFEEVPEPEPGLQKDKREDWWPKMVMLKILQQYYNATGDERVIKALTEYFKYQLKELPERPLDHLTLWANRRGGDNLQVVYWLYNITGDEFLLDLGELLHEQTFPWKKIFLNPHNYTDPKTPWHYSSLQRYPFDSTEINSLTLSSIGSLHTVNFAQGLKEPIVYYQRNHDETNIDAVKQALKDIKKYHGQPQGMYGGDESLHGTNPVQGVEFCSISEKMFSLETILKITGDMEFADLLEKIVFNALPAQASDDFTSRQYLQAANQIELSDRLQTSFETHTHKGTDFVFGVLSGYPCCTTNMHQSWPKFVQNLFYATPDGGVAALLYSPSTVELKVAENVTLRIKETTDFPFKEMVNFEFELPKSTTFSFHLRIPEWAKKASILINEQPENIKIENNIAILIREWKDGDKISLKLPMEITTSQWHEFSTVVERGPLVYSLKVRGENRIKNRDDKYGEFTEVFPMDEWRFGLIKSELENIPQSFKIVENDWTGSYPWNLENNPIELKIKGVKIPEWGQVNGAPVFPAFWSFYPLDRSELIEEITLIPYGSTTLRITEFPTYNIMKSEN